MIYVFCLLGAVVVFLAIIVAFLYFQIIKPMRQELALVKAEREPTSIRSRDELDRHLGTRADIVRLSSRIHHIESKVEELEDVVCARPTREMIAEVSL